MTTKIKSGLIADNAITSAHISSGAISSAHLSSIDTDNVSEGSSNLYFTTARARTSLSVTDSGGDGSLAYDNSTGAITYTGPSAAEVRAHLSAGTGVTYSSGAISIGQSVATTASPTFADINVTGNINVTGDLNTVSVADLDVTDQTITLGAGQNEASSGGSGIVVDGSSASLLWDESNDEWDFNKSINVTGTVVATDLLIDTDVLVTDSTNDRVGINKTSPATTLDVGGSIYFSSILRGTSDGSESSPTIQPGNDGDTGLYRPATNQIGFTTAGTNALTLDASQNATFAGTISSGAINVNSAGAGSIAGFKGADYNQVNIAHSSNTSWGMLLTNSNNSTNSGYHNSTSGANNSIAIVNVNNDALHFGTNNGLKFTIDHLGNLKHGTSQTTILDTSRNLTNIGTINSGAITSTGIITSQGDAAVNDAQIGRLNFTNTNSNASSNPIRASIFAGRQNSAWGGYLSLYTSTGTDAATEKVRIGETGNVGIGTTAKFNSYPARFVTTTLSTPASVGESCHILELSGNRTQNPGNQNGMIQFYNRTSTTTEVGRIASIQGTGVNSGALTFATYATGTYDEAMRIDQNGNVGIGVTVPTSKLTLPLEEEGNFKLKFQASSGAGHAGISTVDQSGAGLYIGANSYANASGVPVYGRSDHPSSGIYFDGWNADRMRFYTGASGNPTEKMTILSDGKVGIGNQDPQVTLALGNASGERLHVYHGGSVRAGFGVDLSGSSRELSIFHSTTGTNGNISFGKRLESNGTYTESMRIAADGHVFFGPNGSTADPRINRHSNGFDYISSGNSRWLKVGASSGHTNVAFQDGSSGVTIFETAGQEQMRIHANGHVSLGAVTDLAFVRPVYRKNITLNKTYTALFNTEGHQLASGFVINIHGTGSSVVVNAKFDVLVNHFQDITISALGTYYTLCKIKVVSNGNEDCTVYAAINSTNNSSCTIEVEPLHDTTLEFSPSSVFSTRYFIHEAIGGHSVGTTGAMAAGAGTTTGYS